MRTYQCKKSSRVECVASGAAAAPETHAAAPGTHAQVPLHALEHAAGYMRRRSALRLREFRWHVCACVQILSGLLTGYRAQSTFCVHVWPLLFVRIGLFL